MVISKNCKICSEIKFEIENVEYVRRKLWVENFESKILSDFKLNNSKNCDFCMYNNLEIENGQD